MTNLTVTKEKAVELKEAGWSKETLFYWESNYDNQWSLFNKYSDDDIHMQPWCNAPTITELLEEMDNNVILQYENDMQVGLPIGDFIDLFRSPDKLAECWIFAKKEGLTNAKAN